MLWGAGAVLGAVIFITNFVSNLIFYAVGAVSKCGFGCGPRCGLVGYRSVVNYRHR